MSAFEVSPEHVRVLVQAAAALGVAQLTRSNGSTEQLHLERAEGQQKLFDLLQRQQTRYHEPGSVGVVGLPQPPTTSVRLRSSWVAEPAQLVQVLQWVRCYVYQSSSASSWPGSDADAFCTQLIEVVLDRLAKLFDVTWTVEPAFDVRASAINHE
jgi:hypothetical protein